MNEPQVNATQSTSTLAGTFEPTTELEKKVDEILRASGIKDEKDITSFEELALKKVSIDEVRLRQAELRAMRELMFRQDQKAKRIAKIKSKTYRRIHKRERERHMERQTAEEGFEGQDMQDEKLKMEAARAKERMTLRHKNTGDWARKMLSRGQHDLETRQAISEQVRRGDDLRRKIMGEDDESDDEDAADSAEELENLNGNQWEDDEADVSKAQRKGVMGMKFMTDAEERQKQANALELAEIQKAMAIGSDEEDDVLDATSSFLTENPGRKTFTPGDQVAQSEKVMASRKQQEETGEVVVLKVVKNPFHMSDVSSIQLGGIDK
jgi:U3 small nucleolar RNA-associated protein 14